MKEDWHLRSRCVGCGAQLSYVIDVDPDDFDGLPAFEPEESGCVQHAHGHLCPPCGSAVADLLRRRREDRERNHAAVVRGHP